MSINTTQYLDKIATGFQEAITEINSISSTLSEKELNTPEASGKWNILQCIEHISIANEFYVKNIDEKLKSTDLPTASLQYKGHWKGRMFAKMNAPKPGDEIGMKLKTFKFMEPDVTLDKSAVMDHFTKTHNALLETVEKTRSVNIDKVKVVTALGPMVKLRIGEAYRFILAHTQRHLVQLRRIKKAVTT